MEREAKRVQPGWRPTILTWAVCAFVMLGVNIGVLVWANTRTPPTLPSTAKESRPREGNTMLYFGDCDEATTIKTWTHLAINAASSLLLLASANCMQCLSSPTRQEIDIAHSKGKFMDIGVLSSRNFMHISRVRTSLWLLLAMSSLPLHLFYNSVFFASVGARSVTTLLASRDFLEHDAMNTTAVVIAAQKLDRSKLEQSSAHQNVTTALYKSVTAMMPKGLHHSGQSLNQADCLSAFSASVVSAYKSVTVVLDVQSPEQLLWAGVVYGNGLRQPWSCYDDKSHDLANATAVLSSCEMCVSCGGDPAYPDLKWAKRPAILECETEPAPGYCGIELVNSLMVIVIVANSIKVLVLVATVRFLRFQPLVTFGDVIRSFLDHPDPRTQDGAPLSSEVIVVQPAERERPLSYAWDGRPLTTSEYGTRLLIAGARCRANRNVSWKQSRSLWFQAVSGTRWLSTLSLCMFVQIFSGGFLAATFNQDPNAVSSSQQVGFGTVDARFFTAFDKEAATLSAVTNMPQLIISTIYVVYYSLFSTMIGNAEFSSYAEMRKGLRVSSPQFGAQRGSYWLTIPFRYAFPLLGTMTVLHWLLSQSIFVVRLNRVDSGPLTPGGADEIHWNTLNGFGFSPIAIVAGMSLGGAITLAPLILSRRKLPSGIPIVGHNSLAIAAACHPDPKDPVNLAEKPLMYGVLPTPGRTGKRRVGFSSISVEPLRHGELYECRNCPQSLRTPDEAKWNCCKEAEAEEEKQRNVVSDKTERANDRGSNDSYDRGVPCDLGDGRIESEATQEAMPSESQSLLTRQHVERHLIPRKPVPISHE